MIHWTSAVLVLASLIAGEARAGVVLVRAKGAQILIVGTHLDDRICSKDYIKSTIAALERKYGWRIINTVSLPLYSWPVCVGISGGSRTSRRCTQ